MDITAKIQTLKDMIMSSKRIAFLGGAGVSTESGIPDFRSENGYFEAIRRFGYPPRKAILLLLIIISLSVSIFAVMSIVPPPVR